MVQVLGGEIGPQVRAVTEDRTVLHQAELLKNMLAGHHVVAGKQQVTVFGRHPCWDRGMIRVDPVGKITHFNKSADKRQYADLQP
jgi:hypothetical protein